MNRATPALIALHIIAFGIVTPARAQFSPEQTLSHAANVQNEPSVAMAGGRAVATWFQNFGQTDSWVPVSYSVDGGASWTDGGTAPLGSNIEAGGVNHICIDPNGRVGLIALVETDISLGASVGFWRGAFVGNTLIWQDPVNVIPPEQYVHDELFVSEDPDRGYYYVTYTRLYGSAYTVYFARSLDGGGTWSPAVALSDDYSSYGRSAVGPDGELYVMWEDYLTQQIVSRRSNDSGSSFGPEFNVGPVLDNVQAPPVGWKSETNHHDPACPDIFQAAPDGPSLAIDRTSGPNRGRLYVAWTDYATGSVGPSLGTAHEAEPDNSFSTANPILIGQDVVHNVPNGHLGQSDCDVFKLQAAAGTMIWIQGSIQSFQTQSASFVNLYCGADTTNLKFIGRITVAQSQDPPFVYTLPESGTYWLTTICATINPFTETYQLRSYTPQGGVARDHRDIVLVSSVDGGQNWTPKTLVSDGPPGDDESFPELAVDGMGQVHAVWYDRRDSWGSCSGVTTYWSMSRDGGRSFVPSHRLGQELSRWECALPEGRAYYSSLGKRLGLAADGLGADVLWTQANCPDSVGIRAVHIDASSPTTVENVSDFRATAVSGAVALTWTVSDPNALLRCSVMRTADSGGLVEMPVPMTGGLSRYAYRDSSATAGIRYTYRVRALWQDGVVTTTDGIATTAAGPGLALESGPNPSSGSVTFRVNSFVPVETQVLILDVAGHAVATLEGLTSAPGGGALIWDGRDRSGHSAPPGVYLVRARSGSRTFKRTIVRII